MAYSEELAERIREALGGERDVREISIFGGQCFMMNGKLFACAAKEEYLFRVGRERFDELIKSILSFGERSLYNLTISYGTSWLENA